MDDAAAGRDVRLHDMCVVHHCAAVVRGQIEMRMTVEIEIGEITHRLFGSVGKHFARPDEASEALDDFDIYQMRRMELVGVSKEAALDPSAKWGLKQKLEQGRRVDHNHADSRSSRMTTAAGVVKVTRLRL